MTVVGIEITDTDSLMAAADILDDVERWITCRECDARRHVTDDSPALGDIDGARPCCEGVGSILDVDPDGDERGRTHSPVARSGPAIGAGVAAPGRRRLLRTSVRLLLVFDPRDFDVDVDPVQQRAADAHLAALETCGERRHSRTGSPR